MRLPRTPDAHELLKYNTKKIIQKNNTKKIIIHKEALQFFLFTINKKVITKKLIIFIKLYNT